MSKHEIELTTRRRAVGPNPDDGGIAAIRGRRKLSNRLWLVALTASLVSGCYAPPMPYGYAYDSPSYPSASQLMPQGRPYGGQRLFPQPPVASAPPGGPGIGHDLLIGTGGYLVGRQLRQTPTSSLAASAGEAETVAAGTGEVETVAAGAGEAEAGAARGAAAGTVLAGAGEAAAARTAAGGVLATGAVEGGSVTLTAGEAAAGAEALGAGEVLEAGAVIGAGEVLATVVVIGGVSYLVYRWLH